MRHRAWSAQAHHNHIKNVTSCGSILHLGIRAAVLLVQEKGKKKECKGKTACGAHTPAVLLQPGLWWVVLPAAQGPDDVGEGLVAAAARKRREQAAAVTHKVLQAAAEAAAAAAAESPHRQSSNVFAQGQSHI
jgi:hypothetical protein